MILASLIACIGLQQSLPANLVPVPEQELFLTQTFYELDDNSRAEQHEFRLNRSFAVESGKSYLTEKRWLSGWIIGDIRLDDPIKPAPIVTKWEVEPNGLFKQDAVKDFQVEEFRIDRLRWFLPPTSRVEIGTNWKVVAEGNPDIHLPKIQYIFVLDKSEKVSDSTRFFITARPIELGVSDALNCEGNLQILVKGNTYSIESGDWTTAKAKMLGNTSDTFKLVQKVSIPVAKLDK